MAGCYFYFGIALADGDADAVVLVVAAIAAAVAGYCCVPMCFVCHHSTAHIHIIIYFLFSEHQHNSLVRPLH